MCSGRFPDWMWVLQMLLDMDAEVAEEATNSAATLVATATTNAGIVGTVDVAAGAAGTGGGLLTQEERELVKVQFILYPQCCIY
jgi:hypothetical protein